MNLLDDLTVALVIAEHDSMTHDVGDVTVACIALDSTVCSHTGVESGSTLVFRQTDQLERIRDLNITLSSNRLWMTATVISSSRSYG